MEEKKPRGRPKAKQIEEKVSTLTNKTNTLKKKLLECLEKNMGLVSIACKQAGVSRTTHYEWLKCDEEYKQRNDEILEMKIDFVESKLIQNIQNNSTPEILYFLKCKAKDRGYGQDNYTKTEVTTTTPENQTLTIKIKSDSSIDEFK